MGYNGCLVGCALSVFIGLPPWHLATLAATAMCAAATVPLMSLLGPLCSPAPQFTLAFNLTVITLIVAVINPFGFAVAAAPPAPVIAKSALEWLAAPFAGISQVFVLNNPLSGLAVLVAIGITSYTDAAVCLLGSLIGIAVALAVSAPASDICAGLWGYNPALTALAVHTYLVSPLASQ